MIFVVNADNRRLFETDLIDMHRQRKIVFVDGLGWKIPVVADLEIDRYDGEDTMYLIGKATPRGELLASVRLLPTVRAHLMNDLFPGASRSVFPRGRAIWEISRFCTAPCLHRRARVQLLGEVVCGVMETALLFGVDQVLFAANSALLPLALHCGWQARTLSPTVRDEDDEVTAVAASITPEGLRRVRQRFEVAAPVTRFHAHEGPRSHPNTGERVSRGSVAASSVRDSTPGQIQLRQGSVGVSSHG